MDRAPAPPTPLAEIRRNLPAPMRDGTKLMADVYFPSRSGATGPVILIRTPYGKTDPTEQAAPLAKRLAGQGFVVVVQDLRGTGASEGVFKAYSAIEGPDGYDTLQWLQNQPWCNGNVGTVGCSYHGEVQDMLAAQRHPAHKAAFIEGAYTYNNGGMRAFSFLRYGVPELAYAVGGDLELLQTLPLSAIKNKLATTAASYYAQRWPDMVDSWLTKGPMDPYWDDDGGLYDNAEFDVPAIHINEWYSLPFSSLKMFELFQQNSKSRRAADHQYLIVSPVTHCRTVHATENTRVGTRELGDARLPYFQLMVDWFNYWLKGEENGITQRPRVQVYEMGRNKWRTGPSWPLPGVVEHTYYLSSRSGANSLYGDGLLTTDSVTVAQSRRHDCFTYDPTNPVPSCGGPVNGGNVFTAGAFDQREVEKRDDVLVYSTPPLQQSVCVAGLVEVVLYVSSSAVDTDFTAKLVDVYPDGRAFNVLEGIVRMRYRKGMDRLEWMRAGEVYEVRIDLDSTCNYFAEGHCIRLEVSSSNFPRFARNLNTARDSATEVCGVVAHNTVYHDTRYRSHIALPLLPDDS